MRGPGRIIAFVTLAASCSRSMLSTTSQAQPNIMRAVVYETGGPEKLDISDHVPVPNLRQNEVLLRVISSAVNRPEILQRQGRYAPPPGESEILGLEAAGYVHSIGPGCESAWKVGDRVMALVAGGGNAEYVAAHENHLIPIPKTMTFDQASAIPETWLTAFQLLHTIGSIERSHTVLIHAGGSGVGTAAVQLAALAGAKAYVTAGSQAKIDVAKSLGALDGFNYKEEDFSEKIMNVTKNQGVDLILDCIGGSFWEQNAKVIGIDGRWISYGMLGGVNVNGPLLATLLRKRVSLIGTVLRSRSIQYKARLIRDFTETALPHLDSGRLKPVIDSIMDLENIAEAHRRMESNANTGKIVLRIAKQPEEHAEL